MTVLVLALNAHAEPYMAVREGYACAQCHVNHTGGGLRTSFGNLYSQASLPATELDLPQGSLAPNRFVDVLTVGANVRLNNTTIFPASSTYEGEPVDEVELQNAFAMPEGNLYVALGVLPDHVTVYLDQTAAPFFGVREAFLLAEDLPGGLYVKGGQILQPYGLRLLDDETSIRTVTQFRYDTSQLGLEVGMEHTPIHWSLAATNGGGEGPGKRFSGLTAAVFRRGRVGLSGAWSDETVDSEKNQRVTTGPFAGVSLGRLTALAEGDLVHTTGDGISQLVAFSELDFLAVRGVNAKVAFDFTDPDLAVEENHRSRFVGGVEVFPVQFLQFSVFYQLRLDIPQAAAASKADRLVAQLHGFF